MQMGFGLEKCANISIKSGKLHRKQHIGNTENEIKELRFDESI